MCHWRRDEYAFVLAQHTSLSSINLASNRITDRGALALATNTSITRMNFNNNVDITDDGGVVWGSHPSITALDLGHTQVGDKTGLALATNHHLTSLNLDDSKLSDVGAIALASNSALKLFHAKKMCITSKALTAWSASASITDLDVRENYVDSTGISALAANKYIETLGFGCGMQCHHHHHSFHCYTYHSHALHSILQVFLSVTETHIDLSPLKHNTILKSLALSHVVCDGTAELVSTITTLTSFEDQNSALSDDGVALISQHPNLASIKLACANVTDECTGHLASMPNLMSLCLISPQLTTSGAINLSKSTSIRSLDLIGSHSWSADKNQMKRIRETYLHNTTITSLALPEENPFRRKKEEPDETVMSLAALINSNKTVVKKNTEHFVMLMRVLIGVWCTMRMCGRTRLG